MTGEKPPIPEFCDMCGRELDRFSLDYRVKIEVISGEVRRDPAQDCEGDLTDEIRRLIEAADTRSDAELMDEIYRKMEFKICPECQKEYIRNPIQRDFSKGNRNKE